jgi:hypothetical protein
MVSGQLSVAYIVQAIQSFTFGELVQAVEIVKNIQIDVLSAVSSDL